jgi:diacylglycerol kinase family enzyme
MAPEAEIDDGVLDIILLNDISRLKLLKSFPLIFKGAHVTIPQVEVFRGKKISVTTDTPKILTPDGEVFGHTPIDVEVLPKCLKVYGKWHI